VTFYIRKRNGKTEQQFDISKIINAIQGAWIEVYGSVDAAKIDDIAQDLTYSLCCDEKDDLVVDVETIQDAVEVALMRAGEHKVARAYIVFRDNRAKDRQRKQPDPDGISNYIHASKYARYQEDLGRRETYAETIARVEDMHVRKFPAFAEDTKAAFDFVREKRLLPSMRSLQFGGTAMEANNCRGFNCSATLIDRPRAFSEALYLLLCGCGVGYSVQFRHVEKLPAIARQGNRVEHHVVQDTIEGWANAAYALICGAISGDYVEFAYHLVRDRGEVLKTSGGRAPGHVPLRQALERARGILLGAQGRQLRPIEVHEILCHFADAVRAGGIRRSAMIALFSLDDGEMLNCKSDASWFDKKPWLARANNSVVLKRDEVSEEQFRRIFKMTRNFGEPGFVFTEDWDHARNPCSEAGLDPVLVLENGTRLTGWSFCNLCEINAASLTSLEDFMAVGKAAALIGTLQASYTDMPYLGQVTERIVRRDALLGIGMTGMQDAPGIALNPEYQRLVAETIVYWNNYYAEALGINSAARTTLVKPSGTTTLELMCKATPAIGSGIHAHHHGKFIRRVTADELEAPFQHFRKKNPTMCAQRPDGSWCIEYPVQVGEGATLRGTQTAIEFLDQVRSTELHWVSPGTTRGNLRHSVSNTVTVKDNEWDAVADYLWQNRWDMTNASFLPDTGDTLYSFAPFEAIKTPEQERRWRELADAYEVVDYTEMVESGDATDLGGEAACAGGACER